MTPTDEATFIALWSQGTSYKAIAAALRCPLGTVASRAAALAAQGKITPRRRAKAQMLSEGTPAPAPAPQPAPTPAQPPATSTVPTREAPAITMVAVPELLEIINRFSLLEERVAALEDGTRDPTRTPPAPASPPAPARVDIEQWTVRLSKALIERIKAEAAAADKPLSHFLEELAWKALNDQSPSMP